MRSRCTSNVARGAAGHIEGLQVRPSQSGEAAQQLIRSGQISTVDSALTAEVAWTQIIGIAGERVIKVQVRNRVVEIFREYGDPLDLDPEVQCVVTLRPARIVLPGPRVYFSVRRKLILIRIVEQRAADREGSKILFRQKINRGQIESESNFVCEV
jgi:hypothetical protein